MSGSATPATASRASGPGAVNGWSGGKWWKVRDRVEWTDDSRGLRLLLCGGGSGAVAKTAVAPLERVKMLLQVAGAPASASKVAARPTIVGAFSTVVQTRGVAGLWQGNLANIVRIIPSKGVLFMSNDVFRDVYGVTEKAEPLRLVASGASAGALATLVTYPLDLVRSRLMMDPTAYSGIIDCLRGTVRAEGLRGLYKGLGPTLCGIIPYSAMSFTSFDLFKTWGRRFALGMLPNERDADGNRPPTPVWLKLAAGALAGVVSQTTSYPLDTVRRRMQVQGAPGAAIRYASSVECLRCIVKEEGVGALFRGASANALRAAPNTAVQFFVYETLADALGVVRHR